MSAFRNMMVMEKPSELKDPEEFIDWSHGQSDDAKRVRLNLDTARKRLQTAFAAKESLPINFGTLKYRYEELPQAFNEIRKLKEGWDGRDSLPPSKELEAAAQALWYSVRERFNNSPAPSVAPGPNGLIEFQWQDKRRCKKLVIGLYDVGGRITCDWYSELARSAPAGDELESVDLNVLFAVISQYLHA